MYANLNNRSSCLQQCIGGVVGEAKPSATISNCANEGADIAAGTTSLGYYQARNNNIGGVIGRTYSTNLSTLTNKAEIACSRMNPKSSATLSMGGIIGKVDTTSGEIDGNDTIVNYGTVYSNHTQYDNAYSALGGVIGEAKCSVKGVVNEGQAYFTVNHDTGVHKHIYVGGVVGYANGNITITSAENKGGAYINIAKAINVKHFNLCVGGVLGTNNDANSVALVSCENSGSASVKGGGTKTNGRSLAIGGIVGALTNGASSITGCTNTGYLNNNSSNNTADKWAIRAAGGCNYIGGIAGYVEGAEGDLLAVTGCTNNRVGGTDDGIGNASNAIYALRGASAGLIGGAKFADIQNCNCTTDIYNTNSTTPAGLVAVMTNSNLQGCTLKDSTIRPNGGGLHCGAFVGFVKVSTITSNTMINSALAAAGASSNGVLAGTSDDASTFTDNAVSGTFYGAAITLDTKMIGAGNPTVTGTTLYTE